MKKNNIVKINNQIKFPEVRLIGEGYDGQVVSIEYALNCAAAEELDLILITENAKPPVCKIIDFNKFLYEKKKKAKEQEKKNKENRIEVKEMRFRPHIEEHDFNFKKNHIIKFLKDKNRVKCNLFFKGREIANIDVGKVVLLKMAEEVSKFGIIESLPKLEGKRIIMMINPKK